MSLYSLAVNQYKKWAMSQPNWKELLDECNDYLLKHNMIDKGTLSIKEPDELPIN